MTAMAEGGRRILIWGRGSRFTHLPQPGEGVSITRDDSTVRSDRAIASRSEEVAFSDPEA